MRVLSLSRLDGHPPQSPTGSAGKSNACRCPAARSCTTPAVWTTTAGPHRGDQTTVFVGAEHATAAYALIEGQLHLVLSGNPGTSPVLAGGLLYVYDPSGGGIYVYRPQSGRPIAKLPGSSGHWNSLIVAVDRHVVEPEGDANEHRTRGRRGHLFSGMIERPHQPS